MLHVKPSLEIQMLHLAFQLNLWSRNLFLCPFPFHRVKNLLFKFMIHRVRMNLKFKIKVEVCLYIPVDKNASLQILRSLSFILIKLFLIRVFQTRTMKTEDLNLCECGSRVEYLLL
jgi:hypothetical protein